MRRYDPSLHAEGAAALVGDVSSFATDADTKMEDNPPTAAFVAVMNDQVVAVVDLSRKGASTDAIDWYKANYDIEAYVPFERHRARAQAVLTDMVVNPIFSTFGRYVLKEAMRLYEKTCYITRPRRTAWCRSTSSRRWCPCRRGGARRPTPGTSCWDGSAATRVPRRLPARASRPDPRLFCPASF